MTIFGGSIKMKGLSYNSVSNEPIFEILTPMLAGGLCGEQRP